MQENQRPPIPLIILGGADRRATELPPSGRGKHPLVGYKGVDIRIGGRCLVSVLVERLERTGAFKPIVVAGPARVYGQAGISVPVIDTDSSFGQNIRVGIETVQRDHPRGPIAITTCDILPDVGELTAQLENYYYGGPYDLWFSLILAPKDPDRLGVFAWKPKYRIVPVPGAEPVLILPGHLAIIDPHALRLEFLYRLFEVGYRTRNRPIAYRRTYMVRQLIWGLLAQDLRNILTLCVPNVTWSVVGSGVAAARKLKNGTITREELERAVRRIFVKTKHRRRFPERRASLPLLEGLSLAQDIDTIEEAQARGGTRNQV